MFDFRKKCYAQVRSFLKFKLFHYPGRLFAPLMTVALVGFVFAYSRRENIHLDIEDKTELIKSAENWSNLREEVDFLNFLREPRGSCRRRISIGGYSCKHTEDGNKDVCLDDHLWDPTGNCLVYSFGLGMETSFEQEFWQWRKCEFHLFDPTIQEQDLPEELTSERHHFHQLGIREQAMVLKLQKHHLKSVRLLPFGAILDLLGHRNRTIDYFKMDVEGSEWKVLLNMLQESVFQNIRQFSVEIHLNFILNQTPRRRWLSVLQENYELLSRLETSAGFRRISFRPNDAGGCSFSLEDNTNGTHPLCGELLYVKNHEIA